MKKYLIAGITILLMLTSCYHDFYPLKGNYENHKYIDIEKPYDQVWPVVIDFAARYGNGFNFISKEDGLIVFDDASMLGNLTFEDTKDQPETKSAYFVVPKYSGQYSYNSKIPSSASVKWNINVRDLNNKCRIRMNFNNFHIVYDDGSFTTHQAASTGVFEKLLFDFLKEELYITQK